FRSWRRLRGAAAATHRQSAPVLVDDHDSGLAAAPAGGAPMTAHAFNSGGPPPSSDEEAIRRGRRRRLALLAWLWPDPLQDGALGGRGAVSRIFGWASSGGAQDASG